MTTTRMTRRTPAPPGRTVRRARRAVPGRGLRAPHPRRARRPAALLQDARSTRWPRARTAGHGRQSCTSSGAPTERVEGRLADVPIAAARIAAYLQAVATQLAPGIGRVLGRRRRLPVRRARSTSATPGSRRAGCAADRRGVSTRAFRAVHAAFVADVVGVRRWCASSSGRSPTPPVWPTPRPTANWRRSSPRSQPPDRA